MGAPHGDWSARLRRCSIGLLMSDPQSAVLSWLGGERIAISGMPARSGVPELAGQGVTHVVNCRARPQVKLSGDLSAELAAFPGRVMHAPMWDLGQRQRPRLWAAAVAFAATALAEDPQARVLIHCHWGKRRSAMVAYAVLRLRGHAQETAAALVLKHRPQAQLVPNYVRSVECWLSSQGLTCAAAPAGVAAPAVSLSVTSASSAEVMPLAVMSASAKDAYNAEMIA